jgi:hypothetical protein
MCAGMRQHPRSLTPAFRLTYPRIQPRTPEYNQDCTELKDLTSHSYYQKLNLKNNGKPTTNIKSIHFVINRKEFNQ